MLEALLPAGLSRFLSWKQKFQKLGYSPIAAARAAGSVTHKRALAECRLEHVPALLRRNLDCVVDVGANRGQWASALLTVSAPRRFEIFEPNPEAFASLSQRLSGRTGVHLHAVALGAQPGELTLHVPGPSEFASFLEANQSLECHYGPGAMRTSKEVVVRVETLDRALDDIESIDLLKIDVQGYERQVLRGAAATLQRTRAILIEANFVSHYKGDESFASLTELLREAGLELWDLAPPFHGIDGRALWCDAVFVNPRRMPP